MKPLFPLLAAVLLAGCYTTPDYAYTQQADVRINVGTFGPYLDPYGSWVTIADHGMVWQPSPRYVGGDFYPYASGGRWVYTNAGWVFDSDYPFGWAVFHYGRWFRHTHYGWLWLPGDRWGPSWVSWRAGGPYVGWAPLGPWGALGYSDWCFVPATRFTTRNLYVHRVGPSRYHEAVAVTEPIRNRGSGPPARWISRATQRDIDPVPVNQMRSSGRVVPPPPPPGGASQAIPPPPPPPASDQRQRQLSPDQPQQLSPPPAGFEPPARRLERQPPPPPPVRYQPPPRVDPGPRLPPPSMSPAQPAPSKKQPPPPLTPGNPGFRRAPPPRR